MTSTLLRSLGTAGEGEGVSPGGVYTPSMAPLLTGLLPGGEPPSLGEGDTTVAVCSLAAEPEEGKEAHQGTARLFSEIL